MNNSSVVFGRAAGAIMNKEKEAYNVENFLSIVLTTVVIFATTRVLQNVCDKLSSRKKGKGKR